MTYIREDNYRIGIFLKRDNRFVAWLVDDAKRIRCHLPNPGRMEFLLQENQTRLIYIPAPPNSNRKTDGTIIGIVEQDSTVINLDTMMYRPLLEAEIRANSLERFSNWQIIRAEPTLDNHRFDFIFTTQHTEIIVKVKSTTRVVNHLACFPDAVSKRAQDHLTHLVELQQQDMNVMLIFLVYQDATAFRPCNTIDPQFSTLFNQYKTQIEVHAFQVKGQFLGDHQIEYNITGELEIIE